MYPEGRFRFHDLDMRSRIAQAPLSPLSALPGAGKSTVLNLLLRFHDPTEGAMRVDGQDLRTVTKSSWRSQIGMVFQDSFLFNASHRRQHSHGLSDGDPGAGGGGRAGGGDS